MPFKKDEPVNAHKDVQHIPSVQDSSTGSRHNPNVQGSFLATGQQNMVVLKKKQKARHDQIEQAERKILEAEENMKKITQEVSSFQNKISAQLSQMMTSFNAGIKVLEKAKMEDSDDVVPQKSEKTLSSLVEQQPQGVLSKTELNPKQTGQITILAQQKSSNTDLQTAINTLLQQQKQALAAQKQQSLVQTGSQQKLTADAFDKCDSTADGAKVPGQKPQALTQVKKDAKQEAGLLEQGQILADSLDHSTPATPKSNSSDTQTLTVEGMQGENLLADNAITTQELEK